jgi:hypothetical protein
MNFFILNNLKHFNPLFFFLWNLKIILLYLCHSFVFSSNNFAICKVPVAEADPDRTFYVTVYYEGSLPTGLTFEGYKVTIGVSEIQINLGNYLEFDAYVSDMTSISFRLNVNCYKSTRFQILTFRYAAYLSNYDRRVYT